MGHYQLCSMNPHELSRTTSYVCFLHSSSRPCFPYLSRICWIWLCGRLIDLCRRIQNISKAKSTRSFIIRYTHCMGFRKHYMSKYLVRRLSYPTTYSFHVPVPFCWIYLHWTFEKEILHSRTHEQIWKRSQRGIWRLKETTSGGGISWHRFRQIRP